MPYPLHPPQHATQCVRAEVQSEVLVVAVEHLRQMRLLGSDGLVTVRLEPRRHLAHEAFTCFHAGCAADGDRATPRLGQVMGKAKEGEGARLLGRSPGATLQQAAVEVQHGCLLGHGPQPKGRQSFVHLLPKPLSVLAVLEHGYIVIREPREFGVASAGLPEASFEPEVKDIVQVDARQHRADGTTLRDPFMHLGDDSVLHHAGFQPLVQEADKSPIIDPMSDEFPQPVPIDRVERTNATLPTSMTFRRWSPSFGAGIRSRVKLCRSWAGCDATARSASSWSCRTALADSCQPPGPTSSLKAALKRKPTRPSARSLI